MVYALKDPWHIKVPYAIKCLPLSTCEFIIIFLLEVFNLDLDQFFIGTANGICLL